MPTAQEILASPDYQNANLATKQAIFDKHIASSKDFAGANAATQAAIKQRFGLESAAPAANEIPQGRTGNLALDVLKKGQEVKKSAAESMLKGGASFADVTVGSILPGIAAQITYPVARAIGKTPEEAGQITSRVSGALDKPFGKAFGITQDPAYQQEASRQITDFIGQNIGRGVDWISRQTGIAPQDVASYAATLAPAAAKVAAPAVRSGVNALAAKAGPVIEEGANMLASASRQRTMQAEAAAAAKAAKQGATGAAGARSMGAAETAQAQQRQAVASGLRVPVELTKGQATRNRMEQAFERETAKQEVGAPLAQKFEQQNAKLLQNFDEMLEGTGAEKAGEWGLREVGKTVDQALKARVDQAKSEVSAAYQAAQAAGETAQPVPYQPVIDFINQQTPTVRQKLAPVLEAVGERLRAEDPGGTGMITVNQMEDVYKFLGKTMGSDATNIRYGTDLKNIIKDTLDNSGGDLYRRARVLHTNFSNEFKNVGITKQLLGTKPGTNDRSIALEDVWNKTINTGSLDDLTSIARTLKKSPEGQAAWRELQGQTVAQMKEAVTKAVNIDAAGNRTISPAKLDGLVRNLDADGKLDYIFGKKGAQEIRNLRDVALDVYTAPAGTVNFSNTSSALIRALDQIEKKAGMVPVAGGAAKMAVGALKKNLEENALAKKVQEAVNFNALNQP